ncbi:MAG: hypothetical protein MJZ94_03490 [Bacteroidales bacterium]|nr:hypothetical protein [Bacteroidales bacterium]
MAKIAKDNFDLSLDIITTLDFSEIDTFRKNEEELNYLNQSIVDFTTRLSNLRQINSEDHRYLATTYRTVRDLERIGDYAENIIEYAESLRDLGMKFSNEAIHEIQVSKNLISRLYSLIIKAYSDKDNDALESAFIVEDSIDDFTKGMEEKHICRLSDGLCSAAVGAQYLSLSSNVERIADHFINVAKTIKEI